MKGARSQVKQFSRTIKTGIKRIAGFGAALSGLSVAGLGVMLKRTMSNIDATAKLSRQLGITTEKLQGLRHAAEITGPGAETLDKGLAVLSKRLGEAAMGSGEARQALEQLGLSPASLMAMTPDEAFYRIADAMQGVATQSEKNAIASKLFSRANQELVNTLALGSEGLVKHQTEAARLGKTYSNLAAEDVENANDAITRLQASLSGAAVAATTELAPAIRDVAETLAEVDWTGGIMKLQKVMYELALWNEQWKEKIYGWMGDNEERQEYIRFLKAKIKEFKREIRNAKAPTPPGDGKGDAGGAAANAIANVIQGAKDNLFSPSAWVTTVRDFASHIYSATRDALQEAVAASQLATILGKKERISDMLVGMGAGGGLPQALSRGSAAAVSAMQRNNRDQQKATQLLSMLVQLQREQLALQRSNTDDFLDDVMAWEF